jgi:hypothetical protein
MIRKSVSKIRRKIKFGINIPLKVFKKPSFSESVTSDLFPIRNDGNWTTEFEFLNLPGLVSGDIAKTHKARMVFFDSSGLQLGFRNLNVSGIGRKTIQLKELLTKDIEHASTFAVFHENESRDIDLGGSFLAERGYTGYKHKDIPVKGYVHGNLDAVSFAEGRIEKLGNYGLFKKTYSVQHLLTGPSDYDFIFTNPTSKRIAVRPILEINNKSQKLSRIYINSLGFGIVKVKIKTGDTGKIKFRSLFYLGRPVVFRVTSDSFDVFHG